MKNEEVENQEKIRIISNIFYVCPKCKGECFETRLDFLGKRLRVHCEVCGGTGIVDWVQYVTRR